MKASRVWLLVAAMVLAGGSVLAAPGGQGPAGPKAENAAKADEALKAAGKEATERARELKEDKARGEATSTEMQTRREERKVIQETYRDGQEPDSNPPKGKKPWWKFWGSDDA
ncbi:MAG: hypothetical protein RIB46_08635 [Pseudomonadales bacterium]